jgi:hypothetical protein
MESQAKLLEKEGIHSPTCGDGSQTTPDSTTHCSTKALQAPVASVDHAQVAQQQSQESGATGDATEGDGVDTPTAISEASSGERSPPFYIRNNPKRKRFLAPTVGQRREFYNHQNGNWKFAMTLYQTRLDGGGADKRRFEKGTMPRKSVFLYVRTSDAGVIEDVSLVA